MCIHFPCGNETSPVTPQRTHKPLCVQSQAFLQLQYQIRLAYALYNLLTDCKCTRFHVSVSAYERGNGVCSCVCLQSQMLINCGQMKVEVFHLCGGLNVYSAYRPSNPPQLVQPNSNRTKC